MERAGLLLNKLRLKAATVAGVETHHLTKAAWRAAVGKTISAHSQPVFLEGDRLTVHVDDAIWQTQLASLKVAILKQLDKVIGEGRIGKIEFRVAPPKREPRRATSAGPVLPSTDEADRIEDPVMRRLYRTARRKASA